MKTLTKILLTFTQKITLPLFFSLLLTGCNKDDPAPIIPKQAILGRWELIKQGNSRDDLTQVQPTSFTEFLNDSSYTIYDYQTDTYTLGDYSMTDSFLTFYYYTVELNAVVDTISVRYYYTFEDYKTLLLDIDALAIQDLFLYTKID